MWLVGRNPEQCRSSLVHFPIWNGGCGEYLPSCTPCYSKCRATKKGVQLVQLTHTMQDVVRRLVAYGRISTNVELRTGTCSSKHDNGIIPLTGINAPSCTIQKRPTFEYQCVALLIVAHVRRIWQRRSFFKNPTMCGP